MEKKRVNMWDVRRQLGVERIRTEIEIAHLRRISHVLRLLDDRLVKRIVLAWNAELEFLTKARKRQQTTLSYWCKLITDAAIPHENLHKIFKEPINRPGYRSILMNSKISIFKNQ